MKKKEEEKQKNVKRGRRIEKSEKVKKDSKEWKEQKTEDKKDLNKMAPSAPEQKVVAALKERGLTMTTVESCTGGMIAAAVTSVAGSSSVFHQGYVTYCDAAKHEMAGVRKKTLRKYTAVSRQTAKEMAAGGARAAKADCCISVTGYAGPPSGEPGEEVGLVYIGCAFRGKVKVKECHFSGTRGEVREQAKQKALKMLAVRLEHQG
ncbi:MAG: CinA family protein [Lachnospiraceae bacterium]|nr:CinA family protein [Lachnospiraceae bacterium]